MPRRLPLLIVLGLLASGALVALGAGLGRAGAAPPPALPDLDGRGTLAEVPDGPVEVLAETVRLGEGFVNRHLHGGPTFNHVISGSVRLTAEDGTSAEYGAGDFFFEPADRPHTVEALDDVRIDVVRLVPAGREPTTTVE